jgi:uncharacterized membrane protein YqjE
MAQIWWKCKFSVLLLKNMENQEKSRLFKFLKIDAIIDNLTGLIETRLALAKIELKEELAKIGARVIAMFVFAFLAMMIIIFFSFWMARLFNSLLDSLWLGFAIVTGFYFLILILLVVFRVHILLQNKIEDALIQNVEDDGDDDEGGA